MTLKDFLNKYEMFINNDIDIILEWAKYNNYEEQLINLITKLAANMVNKSQTYKFRVKEWSSYLCSNEIDKLKENSPFIDIINVIRMIYLSEVEVGKRINQVINTCNNIKLDDIKQLYPYIYKECIKNEEKN